MVEQSAKQECHISSSNEATEDLAKTRESAVSSELEFDEVLLPSSASFVSSGEGTMVKKSAWSHAGKLEARICWAWHLDDFCRSLML